MQNYFEFVKENLFFNKFSIDDLICVEYSCPVESEHLGIYSQSDYLVHVLSGKKTWRTINGKLTFTAGQTFFAKKGAAIITQDFDEEFCMLGFFLPDDLIRSSLIDVIKQVTIPKNTDVHKFTMTKLNHHDHMNVFFQSMLTYFGNNTQPLKSVLKLKLKELLINIIYTCNNPLLIAYLKSITLTAKPSLPHIMETNYCFNLKMEEFARMNHRSLSKFKRDFFNHYHMTPGKWLLEKRLNHAAGLLRNSEEHISDIAFDSGFADISHFSRRFKKHFGSSPRAFRKQAD